MTIRFRSAHAVPVLAALALLALTPAAEAKEIHLHFGLSGKAETPPNDSKGKGHGDVTYDDQTMEMKWKISWKGLSGDATAAHFHGPAKPGASAGPVVAIKAADGITSPLIGSATLTDDQAKQLLAGDWYWNIHTKQFPNGELRGQVVKSDMVMPKAKPGAASSAK
ncbi:MAG TPA: CHRD domain-containing protein [Aliidongia sp.]|nr:CHRD domain-containing protein [Aliidongia sp.]